MYYAFRRTRACGLFVFLVVLSLLTSVPAFADRVDELEQMVRTLAEQNAALQAQLTDLQTEVQAMRTQQPPAADAPPAAQGVMVIPEDVKLSIGADVRTRQVAMDNMWNLGLGGYDDSWEWWRARTRFWLKGDLGDDLTAYIRAANEFKWGEDQKSKTIYGTDLSEILGRKEFFVDNAYVDWRNPLGMERLTLRLGRQDLIYGEGFVLLDGQSNVGSMAIAFDAAKATIDIDPDSKTSLDLIYSLVHEHEKNLADDEQLYGLYGRTDALAPLHLEPYLLHRNKNKADVYFSHRDTGAPLFIDPRLHTTMLGLRGVLPLLDNRLRLVSEGGYQWGKIDDPAGLAFADTASLGHGSVNRRAWAAYAHGTYTFTDLEWRPRFKLGYYLMSGDKPGTKTYEGWDSFYAEWPKWSEGLIYQLYDPFVPLKMTALGPTDRDLGSWTNMRIAQAEIGFEPMTGMDLALTYHYLLADQKTSMINPRGRERGHLVTGLLKHRFNKFLTGHLLLDYFWPGDYYKDRSGVLGAPDEAFFTRWELMVNF